MTAYRWQTDIVIRRVGVYCGAVPLNSDFALPVFYERPNARKGKTEKPKQPPQLLYNGCFRHPNCFNCKLPDCEAGYGEL